MTKLFLTICFLGALNLIVSCKTPKETATTEIKTPPVVEPLPSTQQNSSTSTISDNQNPPLQEEVIQENQAQAKVYDLLINFTSKGEGIDYKTKDSLDQFLSNKNDSYTVETYHWGREGEIVYCFDFGKLSPENKVKMKSKITSFVKGNPLIFIEENTATRYKK